MEGYNTVWRGSKSFALRVYSRTTWRGGGDNKNKDKGEAEAGEAGEANICRIIIEGQKVHIAPSRFS